jgi:hypothetical protein
MPQPLSAALGAGDIQRELLAAVAENVSTDSPPGPATVARTTKVSNRNCLLLIVYRDHPDRGTARAPARRVEDDWCKCLCWRAWCVVQAGAVDAGAARLTVGPSTAASEKVLHPHGNVLAAMSTKTLSRVRP